MTIKNYKEDWLEENGSVPSLRLNVKSHVWNKGLGEYFSDEFQYKNTICRKIKDYEGLDSSVLASDVVVDPVGDYKGHMVVKDDTVSKFSDCDDEVPIMPNYVRDLAGRIICIAECYPLQKEAAKTGMFPANAFCIDKNYEGYDVLENVFFSHFRTLDVSERFVNDVAGNKELYTYRNVNLHPYKLRVDTFYQDGWRIPQTEMLYVKNVEDKNNSYEELQVFLKKWQDFENKDDYESFYEYCGGEEYFEELFNKGVTLIPTFEGYNANAKVDRDFELVDYEGGKVVPVFHEIIEYEDSDLPAGQIIKVIEPGYVTYAGLERAKVVVSNGRMHKSANKQDPKPMIPNLKFPHSRTSHEWGAVYIPTHPAHFEHAAIWGWDTKTGMFMQLKGPIWDPLHYFYYSVDEIIDAYQGDAIEENEMLFAVPDEMKTRFYPVVPFDGFDILDYSEKEERLSSFALPYTNCKRFYKEEFYADIGYHPMPLEYEYEVDTWFMPDLDPKNRVLFDVPVSYEDSVIDVIKASVGDKEYIDVQNANSSSNPYWFNDLIVANSNGVVDIDYPYLQKYIANVVALDRVKSLYKPLFFFEGIDLNLMLPEYISSIDIVKAIDNSIRDYTLAYYEMKEQAFLRHRDRYSLYINNKDDYVMGGWNSLYYKDLKNVLKASNVLNLDESKFSSVAIMQPPTF